MTTFIGPSVTASSCGAMPMNENCNVFPSAGRLSANLPSMSVAHMASGCSMHLTATPGSGSPKSSTTTPSTFLFVVFPSFLAGKMLMVLSFTS